MSGAGAERAGTAFGRAGSARHTVWRLATALISAACFCTLAACGGALQARTTSDPAKPTATMNRKGAGTTVNAPPTPTTEIPPYAFAATWQNAAGLPLLGASGPAAFAFAPSDGRVGYLCVGGVAPRVTRDGGASWQAWHTPSSSGCAGVFVDAHDSSDVFVQTAMTASSDNVPDGYDLWRSWDGGATWRKLGTVMGTGYRLMWMQIAVLGSRLIGQVEVDQEGYLPDVVFYSDDGGMTWYPFAQSVANQGYTILGFTTIGSTIWLESAQGGGAAAMSMRLGPGSSCSSRTSELPLCGQPNGPPIWWRSADGGATWQKVSLPGASTSTMLLAAPAYGGQGAYALAATWSDVGGDDTAMWWSADSGATWRKLPDLRGAESGYVIGDQAVAMGPDGSVYARAQHALDGADDAGIFSIKPTEAGAAWEPLVAGGTQAFCVTETSAGLRLWGIGSFASDSYLRYVQVP